MNLNLYQQINEETEFFRNQFIKNGWKNEHGNFLYKDIGFQTNPSSKNKEWQTMVSMTLSCKILSYIQENKNVKSIWIKGTLTIEENLEVRYPEECPRLKKVADWMKKELEVIGYLPFKDEDAFKQYFSRPVEKNNTGQSEMSFYINQNYPNGFWHNHTI